MLTEKEYKKLEREQKESGYAWKAVSHDGGVIYLDGADKRCSNWLRFVNCARGRCEENVLVRNIPGILVFILLGGGGGGGGRGDCNQKNEDYRKFQIWEWFFFGFFRFFFRFFHFGQF